MNAANWTVKNTNRLVSMVEGKKTVSEISDIMGISDWKIRKVMKTLNMTIQANNSGSAQIKFEDGLSSADLELFKAMLRSGGSHVRYAKHFSVNESTISRAMHRLGIADTRVKQQAKKPARPAQKYRSLSKPKVDTSQQKDRTCLRCGKMFKSLWAGNRKCRGCP